MPSSLRIAFSFGIAALIVGVPLAYASLREARYRNFRVVEEGVLYRSGQMTLDGLRRVIDTHGIRTIVNLRDGLSEPDQREEAFCRERGMNYVRIQQRPWESTDGTVPAETGLGEFLKVMNDPKNHPVLVHCFAGHHRTGVYCAVFRMERHAWSSSEAIHEMYHLGYDTIERDGDIHRYLKGYQRKSR